MHKFLHQLHRSLLSRDTIVPYFGTLVLFVAFFTTQLSAQCRLLNESFNSNPVLAATNTDGAWYPDRYRPAGFTSYNLSGENVLKISIDGLNDGAASRPPAYVSTFYNTQGRKFNQCGGCVTVSKGKLWIPADWATKHRRTDMWATAFDNSNTVTAYPIIGFRNPDGATPEIDYYDVNTGFWVNSGVTVVYDSWYELGFRLSGSNLEYLVNNVVVGTLTSGGSTYFGNIIMQAYNFNDPALPAANQSADSYDAYWDDLVTTGTGGKVVTNLNTGQTFCSIQGAINLASSGDVISASEGTYTETITVNIPLTINGANSGIAGTGSRGAESVLLDATINITASGTVIIDGFKISQTNAPADVILIGGSSAATIQNCYFERNSSTGGQIVRAITTSAGPGVKYIQNNYFTGNLTGGVFSTHKTWNNGIYINGAASTVHILNNTITNCRSALNMDDYQAGITVSGNTFNHCGTFISIGGVSPVNGQFVMGSNNFQDPQDGIINLSNVTTAFRLDITSSMLNGTIFNSLPLSTLFLVEAGMYHRGRAGRNGLVYVVPATEYVYNLLTTLQSAVNYGAPGDLINVKAGTYAERITVTKPLTILGENKNTTLLDGSSLSGAGSGILINNGIANVTISDITVRNYAGTSPNSYAGIYGAGGNNNLTIQNSIIKDNVGGCGIYANGPVNTVLINGNTISGHSNAFGAARGIVIWNGLKENISITNNEVFNNNCCGIELQDGTATGVNLAGNNVHDNGDNGIGLVGLQGPGENIVTTNTVTNNGRFGIEIKNPNGSGSGSGAGSIVIGANTVSRTIAISDLRDIAGIAVYRRAVLAGNVDVPYGVVVSNNNVSGYVQPSTSDGFGIVMEGINHNVSGNIINGNDVGIQRQAGHLPYPGDGDQSNVADSYFGRGNSPITCGVNLTGNIYGNILANGMDTRDVGNSTSSGIVTNTSTGKSYCSIQAAIDDPLTLNGNTITLSAGTYTENVIVTKSVRIQGAGQANSIVFPALSNPNCGGAGGGSLCGGASSVFLIQANNVIIQDLTVDGDNPSLTSGVIRLGADVDARNGIITNHAIGTYNGLEVKDVTVKNIYLRGIYASSGGTFNFHDNTITNVRGDYASIGIFNYTGSGTIINNVVSECNDAISSNWSRGTIYSGNTVTNSGSGIHTDNNSAGVADEIHDNTVKDSDPGGYGIFVFAPYLDVKVYRNLVQNVSVGLACSGQNAVCLPKFYENDIDGQNRAGSTGVYVTTDLWGWGYSDVAAEFTNNYIRNNTDDGFFLESQAGNTLTLQAHQNSVYNNGSFNARNGTGASGAGSFNVDMTCNWWGTTVPATVTAGISGAISYIPYLASGTDANSGAIGFQTNESCSACSITAGITNNTGTTILSCTTPSISLTATGGTYYSWNGGASPNTATNTFITAGTYTVTVTGANGCSDTKSETLTLVRFADIFNASTNCSDFRNCTSGKRLGQICYTPKNGKVSNVVIGQFSYMAEITAPSASFDLDIAQANLPPGFKYFTAQQNNQIAVYDPNCLKLNLVITNTSQGQYRVRFTGAVTGAKYVVTAKYDSKSVIGSTFTGAAPIVAYTFSCKIGSATLPNTSTSINMVPNCNSTTNAISLEAEVKPTLVFNASLSPNPAPDQFRLIVQSPVQDQLQVKVIDEQGRVVRLINAVPGQPTYFGKDLPRGIYVVEVIQGERRTMLKAIKI